METDKWQLTFSAVRVSPESIVLVKAYSFWIFFSHITFENGTKDVTSDASVLFCYLFDAMGFDASQIL